jgi:hypothetical protein
MLPREFPLKSTVYSYFRRFWQESIWSTIQAILLMAARKLTGHEASPTAPGRAAVRRSRSNP